MTKWLLLGLILASAAMAVEKMPPPSGEVTPVTAPMTVPQPPADPEVTMRLSELQLIINAATAQQIAAPALAKMQHQIKPTHSHE